MVAGVYASQVAALLALWLLVGWRPRHGRASVRLWRELARYGSPLVVGLLAARGRTLAEAFVVGRWLSPSSLGFFRYAQRIARIPTTAIIEIGSNSLFPAFSRIAGDRDRMLAAYTRALHWGMVAASATTGLMLALGEPAVVVLFGEPWRNAGVALVAMSGIGIGYAMTCVSEEAIRGPAAPSFSTGSRRWTSLSELGCLWHSSFGVVSSVPRCLCRSHQSSSGWSCSYWLAKWS